jgi:hypothetical protein
LAEHVPTLVTGIDTNSAEFIPNAERNRTRVDLPGPVDHTRNRALVPMFPIMIALTLIAIILQVRSINASKELNVSPFYWDFTKGPDRAHRIRQPSGDLVEKPLG